MNPGSCCPASVIELDENSRGRFIARTYLHLVGANLAFTFPEIPLFKSGLAGRMAEVMLGTPWLVILGAFMVVSWLTRGIAHSTTSPALHRYPEDRHVAAALELFASVALMFWYVLRLFLSRR